ncbi:MAG TPA: glycosyltransferase family 2 protein [Thermoanaerobaculia bacterium]
MSDSMKGSGRGVSVVLPAYREAANLSVMIPRVLANLPSDSLSEVIVVDDHSDDGTLEVVRSWSDRDQRVRGVRLARNAGSHMAILCGMSYARCGAVVVLAADGQDPPELIPELMESWRGGAQVVWAVRAEREGDSRLSLALSSAYYRIMNRWTSVRLPATGADFFLLDRRVVDVLKAIPERNTSLFALVSWLGFRQAEVRYEKKARSSGKSSWTLRKKLGLAMDSLFGFSVAPLKLASALGFMYALVGFAYAVLLVVNWLTSGRVFGGVAAQGWSALMVVILISSGTLMLVLGLFGEYLWRTLEEVRGRPRFVVEESVNEPGSEDS